MEMKLLLFVLLLFASIGTIKRGQAASDAVFYVGVRWENPVSAPCNGKNSNLSLLTVTVTVAGGYGEKKLAAARVDYNGSARHVSPPPPLEIAIDVDQTPLQTAPATPDTSEEHEEIIGKVDGGGVGRVGGGPGDGGNDPDGEGPDPAGSNSGENSDGDDNNDRNGAVGEILSRFQLKTLKKLARISISIAAQTGISLVALPRDKPTASVYLVVVISICAYFFCYLSIILENQSAVAITGAIGICLTVVGFLLTMSIVILPFSVWVFVLSSIIFIISILLFLIPTRS